MPPEPHTRDTPPDAHVLAEFGIVGRPAPLPGGTTGRCYRAGGLVLEPDQDEEVVAWFDRLVDEATPASGFRLPRPVRPRSGGWTVSGWAAMTFVEGSHQPGRWAEILHAGRELHRAIEGLPRPGFLDRRTDPWAVADRATWGEIEIAVPDELRREVAALSELLVPVVARSQVVHDDLCGNALFHDELPPAFIDFSPGFRPPEYAEGILVSDAVLWESAPMRLAEGWVTSQRRHQMLIRACLFRLYSTALCWPDLSDRLVGIADRHAPLTAWLGGR